MEVTYKRSLHKSYMCVEEADESPERYELVMLQNQRVPQLLPVQVTAVDGKTRYMYEISGKQQLEDYISGKKIDNAILKKILFSIQKICHTLPQYLLREDGLCILPGFIYVNLEDESLYFTYLPFWRESLQEAFGRWMEQLLRKIDHQDKAGVELGYGVYQMALQENVSMENILQKVLGESAGSKIEWEEDSFSVERDFSAIKEDEWENRRLEQKSAGARNSIKTVKKEKIIEKGKTGDILACRAVGLKEQSVDEYLQKIKEAFQKLFTADAAGQKGEKERKSQNGKKQEKILQEKKARKQKNRVRLESIEKLEGKYKENLEEEIDCQQVNHIRDTEPSSPTVCLREQQRGLLGKLTYQGNSGCSDFWINQEVFLLGKNVMQVDGVIDAEGVSRLHARISRREGGYYIEDLNSTNGTYINDEMLEYHQEKELHKNDRIRFAGEEYVFS